MNQTIRSFIAIELDDCLKEEIQIVQDNLKKLNMDVKWVDIKNIHFTLKFLGYVNTDMIEKIKFILKKVTGISRPFEISLSGLGVFPKIDFPRVIWIGLNQGKNETLSITSALEKELQDFGFPHEDREFTPHLTLGRIKSTKNKDELKNYINSLNYNFQKTQKIKEITLFQSHLSPKGPAYTKLASFPLVSL